MKRISLIAAFVAITVLIALAQEGNLPRNWEGPCGHLPKGKPKRIKGGEAFPPLPLPATPLRRTERKRDPAPPILIGKVTWGETRFARAEDGTRVKYDDWNLDPNDVHRLLRYAQEKLGVRYRAKPVDLEEFSFDAEEIPILYVTGILPFQIPSSLRKDLRDYLENGGTLWADACRGSVPFAGAIRNEVQALLPGGTLRPLPPDHPVFSCYTPLRNVEYSRWTTDRPERAPYLEGVNIGCRTAIFISPYGLSCAWDSGHVVEGARCVSEQDGIHLGLNMITYCMAYYDLGKYLGRHRTVPAEKAEEGAFTFAQVRFDGEWDPDPSAFVNLLKEVRTHTSVKLSLFRKEVSLKEPNLLDFPFIYMTGHGDFALSEEERNGLRRFLQNEGFLLADACCGDLEFDGAFRREIKRVLPGMLFKEISGDHPIFSSHYTLQAVSYSPKVQATFQNLTRPFLEGIEIEGSLRVVYSRFDLGCGWEREEHPYTMGVGSDDALKMGTNVILYAMTH